MRNTDKRKDVFEASFNVSASVNELMYTAMTNLFQTLLEGNNLVQFGFLKASKMREELRMRICEYEKNEDNAKVFVIQCNAAKAMVASEYNISSNEFSILASEIEDIEKLYISAGDTLEEGEMEGFSVNCFASYYRVMKILPYLEQDEYLEIFEKLAK